MVHIIRNFSVEELEEKYDLPWDAVARETIDKHRWYSVEDLVFLADDGYHYLVSYMDPATEMQDGQERWFDDPMPATRVELVPVMQEIWCPIEVSDE